MENNNISKEIHISMLLLDKENPRHNTFSSQSEIIMYLLEQEQVLNLAKDIIEHGSLSPLEYIGVIKKSSSMEEYIVIEGNRRVCACMLLNNPELAQGKYVSIFKKLREKGEPPTNIECIVFENRINADHWIQLRHEGQQEGIGTKQWDANQKARYSEKRGRKNPNIQANKLLEYAINKNTDL